MNTWLLSLALCLSLLAGLAPAQEPIAPEISPALQARYDKLLEDWNAAIASYSAASVEAKAQRKALPPGPHASFAPRFVELARAGHPGAATWCLVFWSVAATGNSERRELFLSCEATVLPYALSGEDPSRPPTVWPALPGIPEFVRLIRDGASVVGKAKALALCTAVFEKVTQPESKALALEAQANIILQDPTAGAETPAEVIALYRRLAKDFANTETGAKAAGHLFRIENLVIGKTAPDFETRDIDDVPFKLSDYRGKVVVLDIWGFWYQPFLKVIPQERELVERLKDKPFALIGINTDENKDFFRKDAERFGVTWRNSWQGSRNGPLLRAWGIYSFPKILVLDAKGVIRYMGVRGEELDKAVDTLLAENKAK